jgi:serine/threonine-protein kinase
MNDPRDRETTDHHPSTGEPAKAPTSGTVDFRPDDTHRTPANPGGTLSFVAEQAGHTVEHIADPRDASISLAAEAQPAVKVQELPTVAGYQILGILGRGAMGVVYKARQSGLQRLVAMKMILAGGHASETDIARFRSEAEAVGQLQHPNIVQVYEVGDQDGSPFFSLEFVDGGSLSKKINSEPQPILPAAHLTMLLAQGMEAAHQKGIVHRDLKPANVMLTTPRQPGSGDGSSGAVSISEAHYGVPKIADFGLAKRLQEESGQTRSGTILGTPSYMAPEQAEGRSKNVGPLADVYALGAILYELLTGRPPFRGESMWDTLEQVRTQEPVPPSQLQPKVPRDLETICLKCLQKEPHKRYATAGALAEDLRRFLAGEPILARPVSAAERAWRWCRRNPVVATLGAILFVTLLTGAIVSMAFAIEAGNRATEAETARADADQKKKLAEANEITALKQQKRAEFNENKAITERDRADRNAEKANVRLGQTLKTLQSLVFEVQSKLSPDADLTPAVNDELRKIREDLVNTAIKGLNDVAKNLAEEKDAALENPGQIERSMAQAHMQLAEVFRQAKRHQEAQEHYQQAHKLLLALYQADPGSDKNRANLALAKASLGDMEMELGHGARKAREQYLQALTLRQQIVENPKPNFYEPAKAKEMLASSYLKLGIAAKALGDPAQARKYFADGLAVWDELLKAKPGDLITVNTVAHYCLLLADIGWRLGDDMASLDYLDRGLKIRTELANKYKTSPAIRGNLASSHATAGDIHIRLKRYDGAVRHYRIATDIAKQLADKNKNSQNLYMLTNNQARLGLALQLTGKDDEAARMFEDYLKSAEILAGFEPKGSPGRPELMQALARCGRYAEAAAMAERLLKQNATVDERYYQAACVFAMCLAGSDDEAARKGYRARALDCLRKATADEYRDVAALLTDPDLAVLADDREFRELIATIKKR